MALPPAIQQFGINAAEFLAGIDEMIAATDRLVTSLDAAAATAERVGGVFNAAATADEQFARVEEAISQQTAALTIEMDRLTVAMDATWAASERAAANLDVMAASADRAGASATVAGDRTAAAGTKAGAFGGAMKTALLGVSIGLIYGIAKAASFQSEVTKLYTAAGLTGASMAQVSQQILKVGTATGFTGTQIAEAMYHPVSAGLSLKAALAAVTYGAQLAQIHGANLDDTMYALSSVMKAFNVQAGGAGQTAALLNSIVGQGDMRFQDFNQSVKNWAPTAASMGISVQSMGAGLAYLTDRGNSAEVASTRLTMGLSMVTAGSKAANTFLKDLGLTSGSVALQNQSLAATMNKAGLTTNRIAADLKKPDGIYVALLDLQTAFRKSGLSADQADQVMAKLFGGGRSDKAILSLMSNLDGLKQKYVSIGQGVSGYGNSWAKTQETVSFQWKKAVADVQNLAISFGAVLLPAVLRVLTVLNRFMSFLEQHPALAAFAGALLAVAVGFKIAATAEAMFTAVTDASPITLVIMAVIALAAGLYELYTHFKTVRDVVADVGKFFKTVWTDTMHAAGDVIKWFTNGPLAWIKAQIKVFSDWWKQNGAEVKQVASEVWHFISAVVTTAWRLIWDMEIKPGLVMLKAVWTVTWGLIRDAVKLVWDTISAIVTTAIHVVLDVISVVLDILTGHWSKAWNDLGRLCSDAINGIANIISNFASGALTLLYDAGKNIVTGLINGISSMASAAWNAVTSLGSSLLGAAKHALGIGSPSREFYILGSYITKGLALGIGETAAQVEAAAARLAAQVAAAYSAGQIKASEYYSLEARITTGLSSRLQSLAKGQVRSEQAANYAQLGMLITAGVGSGITETLPQAQRAARQLMDAVRRELRRGEISAAQAHQLFIKIESALIARREKIARTVEQIGLKIQAGLLAGLENASTAAQAKAAVDKLITLVQQAWSAGVISTGQASAMTKWLEADNTKLQGLAARRQSLLATIKAAQAYAATTSSNMQQWAGLSNVASATTAGGMLYSGNLLAGMQANLNTIRQFGIAIKKLARLGLRKDLLNQIIQMGPAQGLQVAQALIDGPASVISQMNATEAQIVSQSNQLGQAAANAMYDTGKQAGKGFLSGLLAQEAQLTKMMDRLAQQMVDTLRRQLGLGGGGGHARHPVHHQHHHTVHHHTVHHHHKVVHHHHNATVTVHGFVGSNRELAEEIRRVAQEETLRYARRNGLNNGLNL